MERNSTRWNWSIFHQLNVKNVNVNVVITIYCQHNSIFLGQKKNYGIHNLTGQNRGLSGLKNIWPVIMTGNLLSVIFSPAYTGRESPLVWNLSGSSEQVPLPNFIARGRLALPDFPGLFTFRIQLWLPKQRVKQRSLRAVETILRARLLQNINILQQRTVVLLLWRTSIKNLEKRKIKSETFATWKYWKYRIPELFDKKIWRKNSRI